MGRSAASDTGDWLQWTVDVDVVRSLVGNDTTEEIYYTGDGVPKRTNNSLGLPGAPGPAATRTLGIPKPVTGMSVAVLVAGGGASQTRFYVDTYVNDLGREGAPGVPVELVCLGGSTASITGLDASSASGYPDVTLRRVYCSTDGSDYQRVLEQAVATTTATDSLARGAILQSGGDTSKPAWEMPPSTLKGLIGLWDGMIGGFTGKTYAVCHPNTPWAWPVEYQETIFDDIVATGKWLRTWLILTNSLPYLVTGSSPLNMSNRPMEEFAHPCSSKRSVVSAFGGVTWAGPNGLCHVGQSGSRVVTEGILTAEQWQAMVPSTMIGGMFENYYLGFYNDGTAKGFLIDPINPTGIISLTQGARGRYFDPVSLRLYLQDTSNVIRRWHHPSGASLSVTFKTGIKRHQAMTNPGYALVVADEPVSVAVTLWANVLQSGGALAWTSVLTRTVTSGEVFTLPAGYLAQEYQAQLVTTGPVQGLLLAEDPDDFP